MKTHYAIQVRSTKDDTIWYDAVEHLPGARLAKAKLKRMRADYTKHGYAEQLPLRLVRRTITETVINL